MKGARRLLAGTTIVELSAAWAASWKKTAMDLQDQRVGLCLAWEWY
jgi:hypothetical protein